MATARDVFGAPLEVVFNRPGVALANLVTDPMQPSSVLRALISPESLTPEESQSVAKRLGLSGVFGAIVNAITDPIVLFSLLTSFRFPLPLAINYSKGAKGGWEARNIFEAGQKLSKEQYKMSGLLHQVRSVHANFYGTKIPNIIDDLLYSRMQILQKYHGGFGSAIGRYQKAKGLNPALPLDRKTRILAMAKLEGLDKAGPKGFEGIGPLFRNLPTDSAFTNLVDDFRAQYSSVWKKIFSDKSSQREIIDGLKAIARTGESSRRMRGPLGKKGTKLPDIFNDVNATESQLNKALESFFDKQVGYAPHFPTASNRTMLKEIEREAEDLMDLVPQLGKSREVTGKFLESQTLKQIAKSSYKRRGSMLPSLDDMAEVEEFLVPKAASRVRGIFTKEAAKIANSVAKKNPIPPGVTEYSMDLTDVTASYLHQVSSMYAWTNKKNGKRMLASLLDLEKSGDKARAMILRDTYIPALMGRQTFNQTKNQQAWASSVIKWHDQLDAPWAKKIIPEDIRTTLKGWLVDSRGNASLLPLNRASAGWIYLGALGMNPAAAARNLFQLSLTTMPSIGSKWTGVGLERAFNKAQKYFGYRVKGIEHAKSFEKAFPAYHRSGIGASPMVEEALGSTLSRAWEVGLTPVIKGGPSKAERVKQAMMGLFSGSEQTVRLVTFEGAFAKGMAEGARSAKRVGAKLRPGQLKNDAMKFARKTVQETQFLSGPLNTPEFFADKAPLWRQFTQFTLRYLEYLTHTAVRTGAGHPYELGAIGKMVDSTPGLGHFFRAIEAKGYNPGTLARGVLWSEFFGRMGYEALGLDLDESLLTGAVPKPRGFGAFAPLPVMPPIMSIIGAPLMDLAKGEFKETPRVAPLLIPGGVGAARALAGLTALDPTGMGEAAARMLQKPYADYHGRTPDGRYPLYTSKGNLIGYATPAQLAMKATGLLEGGPDLPKEQAFYKMLLANRDRIRSARRNYIRKVLRGDMPGASKIDTQFQRDIPGVGSLRSWISETDMDQGRKALQITRMEKMLDTLPPQVRPMYAAILQQAFMSVVGPDFMGLDDPKALTKAPTSKARKSYRKKGYEPYGQNMSPMKAPTKDALSFGPGPHNTPFAQFESFAGP